MTIITIPVANGDTCQGCAYLDKCSREYAYQQYDDYYRCEIFKCRLDGKTKCVSCKMLARSDEERERNARKAD